MLLWQSFTKKGGGKESFKNIFVKHHIGKRPALAFTDVITLPQGCGNVGLLMIQHKKVGARVWRSNKQTSETQN